MHIGDLKRALTDDEKKQSADSRWLDIVLSSLTVMSACHRQYCCLTQPVCTVQQSGRSPAQGGAGGALIHACLFVRLFATRIRPKLHYLDLLWICCRFVVDVVVNLSCCVSQLLF